MRRLVSAQMAANPLVIALLLLALFHLLVLLKVLPAGITWGGQFEDYESEFLLPELFALLMVLGFVAIVILKARAIRFSRPNRIVNILTWVVFAFFVLSAVGNALSKVSFEKYFFLPFSLILSLLTFRLAIEKPH